MQMGGKVKYEILHHSLIACDLLQLVLLFE